MRHHSTCHDVSSYYEAQPDPEEFCFFCGGPQCQNYVFFESSYWYDDEDLAFGPTPDEAWLEAALEHCGFSAAEQEPIRLIFALGDRFAAWRMMDELVRGRCVQGPESCRW